MDCVSVFVTGNTNQEVIRLDVTIDQGFVVDRLDTGNLCDGETKLVPASLDEGTARWAPEI